MKAKVVKTGEIISVRKEWEDYGGSIFVGYADENGDVYGRDALEILSETAPEKEIVEGWVARDSQRASNTLHFHRNEVKRGKFYWENKENRPIGESLILPESLFPSITWQSKPKRVRIEITLIDDEE